VKRHVGQTGRVVRVPSRSPQMAFAEQPAGQPTVLDLVGEVAARIEEETGRAANPDAVADLLSHLMGGMPKAIEQDHTVAV
jgi:hypothetical protein